MHDYCLVESYEDLLYVQTFAYTFKKIMGLDTRGQADLASSTLQLVSVYTWTRFWCYDKKWIRFAQEIIFEHHMRAGYRRDRHRRFREPP